MKNVREMMHSEIYLVCHNFVIIFYQIKDATLLGKLAVGNTSPETFRNECDLAIW